MKTLLEKLLKKGWFSVIETLSIIAHKQGHTELSKELETILINYVPEVKT